MLRWVTVDALDTGLMTFAFEINVMKIVTVAAFHVAITTAIKEIKEAKSAFYGCSKEVNTE